MLGIGVLDSNAITKIQSLILIAIIAVAAVGGGVAYVLLSEEQTGENIKIGILADVDGIGGKHAWQGALLAVEEINAEGGILGRQVEIINEDPVSGLGMDLVEVNTALNRLISVHKVDFVLGAASGEFGFSIQEIISQHKTLFIAYYADTDELTQRVDDEYDKYKYFFKYYPANHTQMTTSLIHEFELAKELMGFNKVGYLAEDLSWTKGMTEGLSDRLPDLGFELVYEGTFPPFDTVDFSSYFAAAEAAGVEVLMPIISYGNGIAFIKEYFDRQSPMVIYGGALTAAGTPESWEWTEGKCKYITTLMESITAGYALTSKTLPFREAYIARWGEVPINLAGSAYDIIRFILSDALKRAGSLDTDSVIQALEETNIETSLARKFAFTSAHDVMYSEGMLSNPDDFGHISAQFQWQEDGILVPIHPKQLMEEAGASYIYPDWSGPWDDLD
jgi:branched-chain amino acid transport system substrate-binding protein